jgi:hypothetical protein
MSTPLLGKRIYSIGWYIAWYCHRYLLKIILVWYSTMKILEFRVNQYLEYIGMKKYQTCQILREIFFLKLPHFRFQHVAKIDEDSLNGFYFPL